MIVLTDKQKEAISALQEFVTGQSNSYFLLKGYAGTGKSTVINEFINWYLDSKKLYLDEVVVTAPTNKAVRVLRGMSQQEDVEYKTLHSLLGLKHQIDEYGREVFVRDKHVKPSIFMYGCIIVDEASMIDDELFEELLHQSKHCKIIFVGDPCQIPPVNHVHSKPMMKNVQERYDFKVFELVDIVRQAADNPIIQTSMDVRTGAFERTVKDDRDEKGHGVCQLDSSDKERFHNLLKEKFCNDEFAENSDHAKVIAWRNKTVDAFNTLIRAFLYGRDVGKVVVGEKLILNRPLTKGKKVILCVNDDLAVRHIDIDTKKHHGKDITFYDCRVERLYSSGDFHNIKLIHEDSEVRFNSVLNSLKNIALRADPRERGRAWKKYYKFRDEFSDVSYNYAITAHKSQGSTYDNAFVFYSDITVNPELVEMQRILYTSVTRPSKTLFIL